MAKTVISLTNRIWKIKSEKEDHETPTELIETLAKNRNIDNLEKFTNVSIKNNLPDPYVFIDMEKAVHRIAQAIKYGEKIAILGDYDVDGVSSISIFINFLSYIGAKHTYSIPNRESGYGVSIDAIEKHKDCLIIAVDCGSSALKELAYAKENCIDMVVIDHHKMELIPDAIALVNPHRPDEKDDYKNLCAAGLVFLCCVGVNRLMRESGFYTDSNIKEPNMLDYLDLVALATVCDVVNLTGLNRSFVSTGLAVIRQRKNLGIDAMISLSKNDEITSSTISFFFGPRLNASGRISSADLSVKLLTTKNPIEAKQIAIQLDKLNKERQDIEAEIFEEAVSSIDHSQNFICSYSSNWHVGVIGIVAGRLKEKYNKPSIVISFDDNGKGKASCRSVDGLDISSLICKGVRSGIISSGGGHAMAAGFSLEHKKMDDLIQFLKSEIKYEAISQELYADCFLSLKKLNMNIMKSISVLQPYGMGNQHPKFVIQNVKISQAKIVGEKHIALTLEDDKNNLLRAISFKSLGTPIGEILTTYSNHLNALGSLSIAEWKGKKYINFQLEDVAEV